MNRERLQNVVRVLRSLPPEADFNLMSWLGDIERGGDDWEQGTNPPAFREDELPLIAEPMLIPHNCGASACACGYAGLDPWFRAQGFCTTPTGTVTFEGHQSWEAVKAFFDIETYTAHYLFNGPSDRTAVEVAERVEDFLRGACEEDDDE